VYKSALVTFPRRFGFLFAFKSAVAWFSKFFGALVEYVHRGKRLQLMKVPYIPFLVIKTPPLRFFVHLGQSSPA
jgi:hypothetical protein